MPVVERPSGVRLDIPETFRVVDMAPPSRPTRRRARVDEPVVPTDAASAAAETEALIPALEKQLPAADAVVLEENDGVLARPDRERELDRLPGRQSIGRP